MCDEIPLDAPIMEALEDANKKGWFPLVTALAKEKDGEYDLTHIHYIMDAPKEAVIMLLLGFVMDLREKMAQDQQEEDWEHDRRN